MIRLPYHHFLHCRNALLRNLVTSIIEAERVVTTVPKAKAVRPLVEHMITLAKQDTLHSRRQAAMVLRTPDSVKKLFDTLGTPSVVGRVLTISELAMRASFITNV